MIINESIPTLRFIEFSKPLTKQKIREFCTVRSGSTPLRSITAFFKGGQTPWVKTTDLNNNTIVSTEEKVTELALNETSLRVFPRNSVLIAMYGGFNQIGRTGILDKPAATNQALSVLNVDELRLVPKYLQHYLNAKVFRWRRFAASSRKDPNITSSDVGAFPVTYCDVIEQQKIADFLTAVDSKISQLTEKHRLLKEYKKGVMQQLYSQQIRFKDDDGNAFPNWEVFRLFEIADPIKRKSNEVIDNVMTISAGKGFLHQNERFSQVIAGTSLDKYTHIKKGEFAYNRGNSKSYTYGCIYQLHDEEALIPFIYRSFKLKKGVGEFYAQLFAMKYLDKQLRRLISSSARMDGLLNIGEKDFYQVTLPFPCTEEQQKIAQFLQSIDNKIDAVAKQIEQTKLFKKGLLQQMFV
jgi:type I restriction enzyme S subunit